MLEGIMLRLIYAAHFLHSDTKCVAQTQEVRSCSPQLFSSTVLGEEDIGCSCVSYINRF